jgi:hypothetical protein
LAPAVSERTARRDAPTAAWLSGNSRLCDPVVSYLQRFRGALIGALAFTSCSIACAVQAQADQAIKEPPPADTAGEAPKAEASWGANRKLKSTTILNPIFVPSALVLSYVGLHTGLERAETDHVPFSPRTIDLKIIRIAEGIDGGIRIVDRVGLFVNLAGYGVTSINQESMIVRGGSYRINGGGGVIVKLFQLKELGTQFSLRARASGDDGKIYNLLPLLRQLDAKPVRSAVNAVQGQLGDVLLTPFSSFNWGGDLVIAQPLGRMFSLQGSASMTVSSSTLKPYDLIDGRRHDVDLTTTIPEFGLAAAFDAAPLKVPLGVMLEWKISLPRTKDDQTKQSTSHTQNLLALDLLYTGRSDLQTGFSIFGQWGSDPIEDRGADGAPIRSSDERKLVGALLLLRYFW